MNHRRPLRDEHETLTTLRIELGFCGAFAVNPGGEFPIWGAVERTIGAVKVRVAWTPEDDGAGSFAVYLFNGELVKSQVDFTGDAPYGAIAAVVEFFLGLTSQTSD